MEINLPLTPRLEKTLRQHLATGQFQSASDVISAALQLLTEETRCQNEVQAWLIQELDRGLNSRPSEPVTKEFWSELREQLRAGSAPAND